jgi:hypothetical protein
MPHRACGDRGAELTGPPPLMPGTDWQEEGIKELELMEKKANKISTNKVPKKAESGEPAVREGAAKTTPAAAVARSKRQSNGAESPAEDRTRHSARRGFAGFLLNGTGGGEPVGSVREG